MSTATRYKHVRSEVDQVCKELGRDPEEVLLLAVSKTVDVDQVQLAIDAGARAFGENRPDELVRKQRAFPDMEWHFIGNIQSRRIPEIVSAATLIHSVCKEAHLAKIDAAAAAIDSAFCSKSTFRARKAKAALSPARLRALSSGHVALSMLKSRAL